MRKKLLLILYISTLIPTLLLAGFGIDSFTIKDGDKNIEVKRENIEACKSVATSPSNIWGGEFANQNISKECKKSFVTVAGKIQPMKLDKDIETIGELEVLEFMKNLDNSRALIDTRSGEWLEDGTIPGAMHIAHYDLKYDPILEDDYKEVMKKLGIKHQDGKYSFEDAKEIVVFCNGAWCPQSNWFVKNLTSKGYPKTKIKWYRGGLTSWRALGLTTR
ncbi:MAG: rhodanese-like domain-containing protein [Campylobacterales bacterium]